MDRRIRLHTHIHDAPEPEEESGFIRIIGRGEPRTIYVGKTPICIRVYDKVEEAKHQIQVCKAQGWKVSERVQRFADANLLTRVEIQIRDLARLGVNTETGELSQDYKFLGLQSLWELVTMQPVSCDMFSMLSFADDTRVAENVFGSSWQSEGFELLVKKHGVSQALMRLPQYKRKEVRSAIAQKKFPHDLNALCYGEIRKWAAA